MDDAADCSSNANRVEPDPDGSDGTATAVLAERSVEAVEAVEAVGAVGAVEAVEVDSAEGAARPDLPSALGEIPIEFPARDPGDLDDATELLLMDQYAQPDGTVTVQILAWEREGKVVEIDYALPTGERERDRYRWPTPGQYADNDFLDIVRGLGYAPATAEHVVGEFARARNENGQWRIVTGRQSDGGERGTRNGDGKVGKSTNASRRIGTGGWTAAHLPEGFKKELATYDPMDVATGAVLLLFAAVAVPAVAGSVTAGPSTVVSAVGVALFVLGIATLWLAIVAAADL